jgi:surface protein
MSKLQTLLKEKQIRYKENGIKEVFKDEDGAIDLASIMVGVIVIGLIGGVIAATVFAVIPWAQDNAAKQQLDSIVQAENAYFGLSAAVPSPLPAGTPANSFGKSVELKTANLLTDHPRYCVTAPDDKKSYTGYSQSSSGSIWTVTDKNTKPEPLIVSTGTKAVDALPTDCQFITEGMSETSTPTGPYVDPSPTKIIMTYQCDVATTLQTPVGSSGGQAIGTYTWSDGTTSTTSSAKTLAAGTKYTFIFEGTANYVAAGSGTVGDNITAGAKCIRSLDHWGTATNTTVADGAFRGAVNLTNVPANIPSTLTSTLGMFDGATSFNDPDVKNWNVSKVTDMRYIFSGATSFNQDLSGWNTAAVTNMAFMFNGATAMNGGLNGWNTAKVISMDRMFYGASSFNQPLDKWNTTNVANMHMMFFGAPYTQDLTSWDMNKVVRMGMMLNNPDSAQLPRTTHPNMFRLTYQCDAATTLQTPVGSSGGQAIGTYTWSDGTTSTTSSAKVLNAGTKYTFIFEGTANYVAAGSGAVGTNITAGAKCIRSLDHWGTATNTTVADGAFRGAVNLTNVPAIIPSTFTSTLGMFDGATSFNDPDVKNWDVSKVTDMRYMFNDATSFNQDLSGWNTAAVTNMAYMFNGATAMNGGLNGWNTLKVTSMDRMFYGASSFNQPLNNWNTSNVTNMHMMFFGAPYTQDLTSWDMNKVARMAFMLNNPDSAQLPRTTHPNMFRLTYQCDAATTLQTPVGSSGGQATGTFTWSDGTTSTTSSAKTLAAGTKYTFIFEGTANYVAAGSGTVGDNITAGAKCIRSLDHWGTATNTTVADGAFRGAVNLTNVSAIIPSTFTKTVGMFDGATSFNDPDVKNWDVSKVTNMSYMFSGATGFNQDLKSSWNTAAVTNGTFFAPASFPDAYMPANTSK